MPRLYTHFINQKVFENKLFNIQVKTFYNIGFIIKKTDNDNKLLHFLRSVFFSFSCTIACILIFVKFIINPEFGEGSAMSVATAFLYLSTSIVMNTAFFKRQRLAQMLVFVQNDIDKLSQKSDESEEKLFKNMQKYVRFLTVLLWGSTAAGATIAYVEAFYTIIVESIFNIKFKNRLPLLLNRLFPFQKFHDGIFFRTILPMYALLVGVIAVPVWHTFITSLMGYVILKWQIMQKRLRDMDFGKLIRSYGKRGSSALSPATAFLYLTTSIAIHSAFFRRKRFARMLNFLLKDLDKLLKKSDKEEEIFLEESHKYMHLITVCIWIPSLVAGGMAYIEAFYKMAFYPDSIFNLAYIENYTDTQPLLTRLFPFREVHGDLFVGYILPMYALFLGIMVIPLWHTFITGLMSYVVLKWRILHKRLSQMDVSKVTLEPFEFKYYSSLVGEDEKVNYLRTRMCKYCVIEQIRIRWFVNELRELIGVPVFADFIIFSILICFLFYELATGNATKMDIVFMFLYLFVMSSILWLYHWHATLMKENSQEMGFALYSCDWYNYPVKVQKLVQMVMIITARPLEITAVLVPLSLTTFIDIIRASYSYFSLLRKASR